MGKKYEELKKPELIALLVREQEHLAAAVESKDQEIAKLEETKNSEIAKLKEELKLREKTIKEQNATIERQSHLASAVDAKDEEITKLTNDLVKTQDKINDLNKKIIDLEVKIKTEDVEELKEENEQLKADIAFLERKFLSMTDIFAYNLKDQQALLERNNFSRNEIWEDFNLYRQNKTQREKGKEVKK
ncbi:MAG TPA: hypothetical protein PLU55_03615 [Candidatus Pacearchaeota archaeon]|nr:hypothetical protein [Candidatus Pacearchaeota archaeon]